MTEQEMNYAKEEKLRPEMHYRIKKKKSFSPQEGIIILLHGSIAVPRGKATIS